MFGKIVAFGALVAAYLSHAVSSQSIIRHDEVAPHYDTHYAAPALQYAGPVGHYAAPITRYPSPIARFGSHDAYAHPKYNFAYSLTDPHSEEHSSQHEGHIGDDLHGHFPRGHNGFNSASFVHSAHGHGHYHH